MYISKLQVRNYRNFYNSTFIFKDWVNTIIWENASWKTNILEALRIVIDNNLARNYRLLDSDFSRKLNNFKWHWIIIKVDFSDLWSTEWEEFIKHLVEQWDSNNGSLIFYFRPKTNIRQKLFQLNSLSTLEEKLEKFNEIISEITIYDYEWIQKWKWEFDISNDEKYKEIVGDFENYIFPDPSNEQSSVLWVSVDNHFYEFTSEISCTYIKALRDAENELKSYNRNNPLWKMLQEIAKNWISESDVNIIETSVKELNEKIETNSEITKLSSWIRTELKDSIWLTYSPNIKISSEISNNIGSIFKSLSLKVWDSYSNHFWDLKDISLWWTNLIYISLKLLEYELNKKNIANFLLLEEPEAHIHNHIQKTLFNNIQKKKTQIFLTTHSTQISSISKISSMNILSSDWTKTDVFLPYRWLQTIQINHIERYLDAIRTNLLFAKNVILVEWDAELILIPLMVKKVFWVELDELWISLISIWSTWFKNISDLFHEDRIKKNCAIITDQDKSIVDLTIVHDASTDDWKKELIYQTQCKNSEEKWQERKTILKTNEIWNSYLKSFFAEYTFEIDWFLDSQINKNTIISLLEKIYSRDTDKDNSKIKLESPDKSISWREALRLANKEWKWWYAILIWDELSINNTIPKYILEALSFVSRHVKDKNVFLAIIKYRLDSLWLSLDVLETDLEDDVIDKFKESFPEDQFTYFLNNL